MQDGTSVVLFLKDFNVDHFKIFTEFVNIIASVFYVFWFFSLEAGNESIPTALEGKSLNY